MEGFFGIGIPEILLILVLALIILGPQDMVSTARKLGRWVYRAYHSPIWRQIVSTSAELRDLPTKFVREAGLEDTIDDLKKTQADVKAQLKEASDGVSTELQAAQKEASLEMHAAGQATAELKEASSENRSNSILPPAADPQPDSAAVIQPDPALVQAETQPSSNGSDHTPPAPLPYHPPEPPSDSPPPDEYSI